MRLEINGINMSIADSLREKVEKRVEKWHRLFSDEALLTVKCQPEREEIKVEFTLKIQKDIFRSEAIAPQSKIAIDKAADNMEGQFRKQKAKLKKRTHQFPYLKDYLDQIPEQDATAEAAEPTPEILRVKHFPIEPMVAEEAALQMELMGHDFHLYLNPDSGRVALIYRRKDGNYGVLEPEY